MNTEEVAGLIRPLCEVEREHILRAMELGCNNKPFIAECLGIKLNTLYYKLHQYGIAEQYRQRRRSTG